MSEETCKTDEGGNKTWYKNGLIHRDGGLPAIECVNGHRGWYEHGEFHRDGGLPASVWANGSRHWYRHGKHYRDSNLPTTEHQDGRKHWYRAGKYYTYEQLSVFYIRLARFGQRCLAKFRTRRLKQKRWIHGELLCRPLGGGYPGGLDYHGMAGYFGYIGLKYA